MHAFKYVLPLLIGILIGTLLIGFAQSGIRGNACEQAGGIYLNHVGPNICLNRDALLTDY